MCKRIILIFVLTAAHCLIGTALFSVDDVITFPRIGHRMPAVIFTHRVHSEQYVTQCVNCHHFGKNSSCSTCHLQRDQGSTINIKGAFHQHCIDCHRKTHGPLACNRCHRGTMQ